MRLKSKTKLKFARWTVFAAALQITCAVWSQEPANQDKTGRGATGHHKPAPDATGSAPGVKSSAKNTGKGKTAADKKAGEDAASNGASGHDGKAKIAYDYELPGPDGKGVPLSTYRGKVLLIVNLAHNSSYNSQIAALEKLNQQYKDKGMVVIGIPSNDFGAAEPGTDVEIQKIYKTDDKVTFPVMAKASVAGNDQIPLYGYLTKGKTVPPGGPVHWNYTKFLIGKDGKVVARFNPEVTPDSAEMMSTLEQVLSGTFKPHKSSDAVADESSGDDDDDG